MDRTQACPGPPGRAWAAAAPGSWGPIPFKNPARESR